MLVTTINDPALWYLSLHKEHKVKLYSGTCVGIAQCILGQQAMRNEVPFLINHDNVI